MRESEFDGGLLGLIGINILYWFIILITFGIGTPWAIVQKQKWYTKHTIINGKRLYFDGTGMQLIGSWIKWLFFIIITLGIYYFWVSIKIQKWVTKHTHFIE